MDCKGKWESGNPPPPPTSSQRDIKTCHMKFRGQALTSTGTDHLPPPPPPQKKALRLVWNLYFSVTDGFPILFGKLIGDVHCARTYASSFCCLTLFCDHSAGWALHLVCLVSRVPILTHTSLPHLISSLLLTLSLAKCVLERRKPYIYLRCITCSDGFSS